MKLLFFHILSFWIPTFTLLASEPLSVRSVPTLKELTRTYILNKGNHSKLIINQIDNKAILPPDLKADLVNQILPETYHHHFALTTKSYFLKDRGGSVIQIANDDKKPLIYVVRESYETNTYTIYEINTQFYKETPYVGERTLTPCNENEISIKIAITHNSNKNLLYVGNHNIIDIWDTSSKTYTKSFCLPTNHPIKALTFGTDNILYLLQANGVLSKQLDNTLQTFRTIAIEDDWCEATINKNGNEVYIASNKLLSYRHGTMLCALHKHIIKPTQGQSACNLIPTKEKYTDENYIRKIALTPIGKTLAVVSGKKIWLLDTQSNKKIASIDSFLPLSPFTSLSFSSYGDILYAARIASSQGGSKQIAQYSFLLPQMLRDNKISFEEAIELRKILNKIVVGQKVIHSLKKVPKEIRNLLEEYTTPPTPVSEIAGQGLTFHNRFCSFLIKKYQSH